MPAIAGTELTRELTHEVYTHPEALYTLLDVLIRARVRGFKLLLDTSSQLVEAILPPTAPDPAARTAFLAALAAEGFDDPLSAEDLAVAVAVEGGDVPDRVLSSGISAPADHPLVIATPEGIRPRRCGVLTRLRDDASRMLLDSLAAEHEPGHEDWLAHRWALLPVDAPPDARPDLRADAIRAAEPVDVIHLVDTVVADLCAAHPAVDMELDLPAQVHAAVTEAALRTIPAELLQDAVDAVTAANRHRIRIVVHSDPDDVLLDVADDGAGGDAVESARGGIPAGPQPRGRHLWPRPPGRRSAGPRDRRPTGARGSARRPATPGRSFPALPAPQAASLTAPNKRVVRCPRSMRGHKGRLGPRHLCDCSPTRRRPRSLGSPGGRTAP